MNTWINQWYSSLFELWMLSKRYHACSWPYHGSRKPLRKVKPFQARLHDVRFHLRQIKRGGHYA